MTGCFLRLEGLLWVLDLLGLELRMRLWLRLGEVGVLMLLRIGVVILLLLVGLLILLLRFGLRLLVLRLGLMIGLLDMRLLLEEVGNACQVDAEGALHWWRVQL